MTETFFPIEAQGSKILDVDSDLWGNYIAITNSNKVIGTYFQLDILQTFRFPVIRQIDEERFLIADARSKAGPNAFIFNKEGQQTSFRAGDGIEDILIINNQIVFTYFDEGVFGDDGPNNEGLAVFDFDGKLLFGFNSAADGLIADCYAVCKFDNKKILFFSYTDFPLIELNTETLKWKQYSTPPECAGAHAMVSYHGNVVFHGGYDNRDSFFLWNIHQQQLVYLNSYSGYLRGMSDGKFLHTKEDGFSIIDVTE